MEIGKKVRLLAPVFLTSMLGLVGLSQWKSLPLFSANAHSPETLSSQDAAMLCAEQGRNPNAMLFVSCAGFLE